jgi:SAM-dependent methyltransferase
MAEPRRDDAWAAGANYERYMGRWSRTLAPVFIDWLEAPAGADWLEVGCGTGALTAAILSRAAPLSVLAIDPSQGFLSVAIERTPDPRVTFVSAEAAHVPAEAASRQVAVSGLVLNFVPDIVVALREMRRVVEPGGTVGFYVWDYPGNGIEFISRFWQAAIALDPAAAEIEQGKRFAFCTKPGVGDRARAAGLEEVEVAALEIDTVFAGFEDYWEPFTLGTGPAPGYCARLTDEHRSRLRQRLQDDLPARADGSIALRGRAWGVRARNPA